MDEEAAPDIPLREVGDAMVAIHHEGGDQALSLVATLMERNRREAEWVGNTLYEGEKFAHEKTKERLRDALDRLQLIEHRSAFQLGLVHTPFPEYEQ